MQSLSSYDLFHIIKELQVLVGGKVEKIFQQDNKEERLELKRNKSSQQQVKTIDDFLFNIHVTGKGKHLLYLSITNSMFFIFISITLIPLKLNWTWQSNHCIYNTLQNIHCQISPN